MNRDRAGGNPPAPANGDETVHDGNTDLIPRTPWNEAPANTSPYPDYECPSLDAVLAKADSASPVFFEV